MSKFSTNNNGRNNSNQGRNNQKRNHDVWRRNRKPNVKVETKDEAMAGVRAQIHSSKFVPSNSGGLMSATKINGRIVFPDRRGPQPKNDGKNWRFYITGENPKQTVFFARVIDDSAPAPAVRIVIEKSGKMICLGRRLMYLPFIPKERSQKPKLAEYRSATPNMGFEPHDDRFGYFYADDGYGHDHNGCGCGHDHDDGEDCDGDDYGSVSAFVHEATVSIWDSLPTKPVNCHSCGFEDCRCDGTGSDWVPARTTLNVLQ